MSFICYLKGWNYSLMNLGQLHILFNSAKTWHVIVCWFLCFPRIYLNLPELNLRLFCSNVKTILGSAQVNLGENTEINKQSHVKFWLHWMKYEAISYSLSCTYNCFGHQYRTISGSAQVNSGQNTEINKQSHVKFWLNWIKYEAVSYSLSCTFVDNLHGWLFYVHIW